MQINTILQYEKEVHNSFLGSKEIIIESLTPKLADTEKKTARRTVEENLYSIFRKYQ